MDVVFHRLAHTCNNCYDNTEPTFLAPAVDNAAWVDLIVGEEKHFALHEQVHAEAYNEDEKDMRGDHHDDEHSGHEHAGEEHSEDEHSGHGRHGHDIIVMQPHGMVVSPIFDSFDKQTRKDVGSVTSLFSLEAYLINLLPNGVNGFYVVVKSSCTGAETYFTYRVNGNHVSAVLCQTHNNSWFSYRATNQTASNIAQRHNR